jgi:hypothetical protein
MQELIPYLIAEGTRWVGDQRNHYRPLGRALSEKEWTSLAPFYSANILETVVVRNVRAIENPDFYRTLSASGQQIPLDFSEMDGITFIDTIAVVEQQTREWGTWLPLLFHECVHVCQYKLLGVDEFLKQYVGGWAAHGFDYYSIPLETQAYQLQSVFEKNQQIFSVEEILKAANGA